LVLYDQYTVYSILYNWSGSAERMGLFNKTRCLYHPLHSSVPNEPFRVRRTAVPHFADVDLFGDQGEFEIFRTIENIRV